MKQTDIIFHKQNRTLVYSLAALGIFLAIGIAGFISDAVAESISWSTWGTLVVVCLMLVFYQLHKTQRKMLPEGVALWGWFRGVAIRSLKYLATVRGAAGLGIVGLVLFRGGGFLQFAVAVYGVTVILFKKSSAYPLMMAAVLFLFTPLFSVMGHSDKANSIAIFSYYFLLIFFFAELQRLYSGRLALKSGDNV